MFGLFKQRSKGSENKPSGNGGDEPSAIQKMKRAIEKGIGVAPDGPADFTVPAEDEMTDEEYTGQPLVEEVPSEVHCFMRYFVAKVQIIGYICCK